MVRVLLATAAALLLLGCQKRIDNVNEDFVGSWTTNLPTKRGYAVLEIDNKGKARYEEYHFGSRVELVEGVARMNDDLLRIGSRKQFTVVTYPTLHQTAPPATTSPQKTEDEYWTMRLGNRNYLKH